MEMPEYYALFIAFIVCNCNVQFVLTQSSGEVCPSNCTYYKSFYSNGICYSIIDTSVSYNTAVASCKTIYNSTIAVVTSADLIVLISNITFTLVGYAGFYYDTWVSNPNITMYNQLNNTVTSNGMYTMAVTGTSTSCILADSQLATDKYVRLKPATCSALHWALCQRADTAGICTSTSKTSTGTTASLTSPTLTTVTMTTTKPPTVATTTTGNPTSNSISSTTSTTSNTQPATSINSISGSTSVITSTVPLTTAILTSASTTTAPPTTTTTATTLPLNSTTATLLPTSTTTTLLTTASLTQDIQATTTTETKTVTTSTSTPAVQQTVAITSTTFLPTSTSTTNAQLTTAISNSLPMSPTTGLTSTTSTIQLTTTGSTSSSTLTAEPIIPGNPTAFLESTTASSSALFNTITTSSTICLNSSKLDFSTKCNQIPNSFFINGICYSLVTNGFTYAQAVTSCEKTFNGGTLAVIRSADVFELLKEKTDLLLGGNRNYGWWIQNPNNSTINYQTINDTVTTDSQYTLIVNQTHSSCFEAQTFSNAPNYLYVNPTSCTISRWAFCETLPAFQQKGCDQTLTRGPCIVASSTTQLSTGDCAKQCAMTTWCAGFNYNPTSQTCEILNENTVTQDLQCDPDWVYYERI